MSVIARQGFKYSIIGYLGFLLGTGSNFFLFPYDLEFYGKLRFIFPMAEMLVPIVVFGVSFSNVKFFSLAQKSGRHQNMLSLSLLLVLFNFLLFSVIYILMFNLFPDLKESESWKEKYFIFPLILALSISTVFNKYISNYNRIAIPNIFENLFPKIANILAFSLFFFLAISEKWSLLIFVLIFFGATFSYFFYANHLEPFKFDFRIDFFQKNALWRDILVYSFFGFLGNIGSFLALKIANVMIGESLGFEQNGLYSNIYSIVALINIPQMGLFNISAPLINKHLTNNTLSDLNQFYKKTSLTLFFLGLILFSCIVVGFPFLTDFMKNGILLKESFLVLWIIGGAMLFDLATGFNSHIISLSHLYKYNTFFMLILAGFTIGINLIFLKYTDLGIMGIAISYAISLTLFNLIKIIFNYYHFKVSPFSRNMLLALVLCTFSVFLVSHLPKFESSLWNLIFRPIGLLSIIVAGNHFLRIYPIDSSLIKKIFGK